jgi:hypothetical protein
MMFIEPSVWPPAAPDFDIEIRDADVGIIFKPMMSRYSFPLLAERRKVSPIANVRHVKTADSGDYASGDRSFGIPSCLCCDQESPATLSSLHPRRQHRGLCASQRR